MVVTKYGRGYYTYATPAGRFLQIFRMAGSPGQVDGEYRSAQFTPSMTNTTNTAGWRVYVLPANDRGQVGIGGDSGGPDIVTAPNGVGLGIAGVTSNCAATGYVPGEPQDWNWATGVSDCQSSSIYEIYFDMIEVMNDERRLDRHPVSPP